MILWMILQELLVESVSEDTIRGFSIAFNRRTTLGVVEGRRDINEQSTRLYWNF